MADEDPKPKREDSSPLPSDSLANHDTHVQSGASLADRETHVQSGASLADRETHVQTGASLADYDTHVQSGASLAGERGGDGSQSAGGSQASDASNGGGDGGPEANDRRSSLPSSSSYGAEGRADPPADLNGADTSVNREVDVNRALKVNRTLGVNRQVKVNRTARVNRDGSRVNRSIERVTPSAAMPPRLARPVMSSMGHSAHLAMQARAAADSLTAAIFRISNPVMR